MRKRYRSVRTPLMLLAAVGLLLGSVAFAAHVTPPPPVARGGELAYVKSFPENCRPVGGDLCEMKGTYVSLAWRGQQDDVLHYTSRGRIADKEVFHKIDLPMNMAPARHHFHDVQHVKRGILMVDEPPGYFLTLNGVNAGMMVAAKEQMTVRFHVSDGFDIQLVDPKKVKLRLDGHTYNLQLMDGMGWMNVQGRTVLAYLERCDQVRGWISGFPSTTAVMNYEFDHIISGADIHPPLCPKVEQCPPEDPYATTPTSDPYATSTPMSDPYATTTPTSDPYATTTHMSDPYATTTPTSDPYATTTPYATTSTTDPYATPPPCPTPTSTPYPTTTTTYPPTTSSYPPTSTPYPTTTSTPYPTTTSTPYPTTTSTPYPTTTSTPYPTTTSTPYPTTTSSPYPTTTSSPYPTTTSTPYPTTTSTPYPTTSSTPYPTTSSSPYPTTSSSPYPTATSSPYPTTTSSPYPTTTSSPYPTTTSSPYPTTSPAY
jgi:hypothetical protein